MPKKSGARKPLEKKEEEAPAFAGMKLKKSERVQRKIEGPKMETVDLKHHDFEKVPLEESPELTTVSEVTPFVGVTDRDYSDDKNKDEKPKKKKKKKKSDAGVGDGDEEDEEQDDVSTLALGSMPLLQPLIPIFVISISLSFEAQHMHDISKYFGYLLMYDECNLKMIHTKLYSRLY